MRLKLRQTDILFSRYIRKRAGWHCERCGKGYEEGDRGLHASHYFSRKNENTRFCPLNVFSHCFGCHQHLGSNPEEFRDWVIKKIGQKEYDKLKLRAHLTKKRDDKQDLLYIKELIKNEV